MVGAIAAFWAPVPGVIHTVALFVSWPSELVSALRVGGSGDP